MRAEFAMNDMLALNRMIFQRLGISGAGYVLKRLCLNKPAIYILSPFNCADIAGRKVKIPIVILRV